MRVIANVVGGFGGELEAILAKYDETQVCN
jgi:hypothetical protein